ncbi:MAG: cysteine--tRNA ligase [Candidatus Micrarchaeota archaeon]|nr:cysteine--tRNA ligase [Candidatus Micrarchaeota archaeon]
MQPLQIYNTLTRKKEKFAPLQKGSVHMYACGPTVYFYAHIGNLRTYISQDVLRRALEHEGYKVKHVVNLTDVGHLASDADTGDDKIRTESEKERKSMREITDFYSKKFIGDIRELNILSPDMMPKPSEHIADILSLIKKLDGKRYLYKVGGDAGGMYYDTSRFKGYGALTGMNFEKLQTAIISGYRVERPEGIRNPTDFAVWRFADPSMKEFVWDSEYGRGFPGWHIECSAMSMKYLGEHFDIHCGGVDHIPIHHTNEIAQSEAATGEKFVNYWVHMEFMQVDRRKMSKSFRNIYTLEDLEKKGHSALGYRYFTFGVHYRKLLNFTFEKLKKSEDELSGIYAFLQKVAEVAEQGSGSADPEFGKLVDDAKQEFFKAIADDLNVPVALAKMHSLINDSSTRLAAGKMAAEDAKKLIAAFTDFDSVLGLEFAKYASRSGIDSAIEGLIAEREKARKGREFKRADEIRTRLLHEFGIALEDTPKGVRWYRVGSKKAPA